jgi:hypothetical protein
MHRFAFAAAGALLLVAVSGCSTAPEAPETTPESSASAAPKIDPGPVTLTVEEAGNRYLDIVCGPNIAGEALYAALTAGEPEFVAGGAPDPAAVKAAAAARAAASRLAVAQIDDTYFVWPEKVAPQLALVRAVFIGDVATYQSVSSAATFSDAYYAPPTEQNPEQQAAGQEIRYQLDISADTVGSCAGHETGLADLAVAQTEREEALSKQG